MPVSKALEDPRKLCMIIWADCHTKVPGLTFETFLQIQQRGAGDSTMDHGHPWSTLSGAAGIKFYPEWDPAYMAQLQKYIRDRKIKNCFWWSFNADSGMAHPTACDCILQNHISAKTDRLDIDRGQQARLHRFTS